MNLSSISKSLGMILKFFFFRKEKEEKKRKQPGKMPQTDKNKINTERDRV